MCMQHTMFVRMCEGDDSVHLRVHGGDLVPHERTDEQRAARKRPRRGYVAEADEDPERPTYTLEEQHQRDLRACQGSGRGKDRGGAKGGVRVRVRPPRPPRL